MTHVLLFIPNVIGYVRVLLTAISFIYAKTSVDVFLWCYISSFLLDFFDGYFAKKYDQCSKFGGILDMITDRCATAGLLLILSHLYLEYWLAFLFLLLLDAASHWFHTTSANLRGGHHKEADTLKTRMFLVRWFYGIYPFFGYCCCGTEFFYIGLYVLGMAGDNSGFPYLSEICWIGLFPACVMKNIINVAQLGSSVMAIAKQDMEEIAARKKN